MIGNGVRDEEMTEEEDELESGDSETESSEEEEPEPVLKYKRMVNDLSKKLEKDKMEITAIAMHERFLLCGTAIGNVYQFDYEGNEVGQGTKFPSHSVAINCLSVEMSGEYYASGSNDGRVNVFGFFSTDSNLSGVPVGFPVKQVALDPKFSQSHSFCVGGDRPVLYEKGFLGKLKTTDMTRTPGRVDALAWHEQYIAFSTSNAVQVYDTQQHKNITAIKKLDLNLRNDLYPCHLAWQPTSYGGGNVLLIGWGKTVKICKVVENLNSVRDPRKLSEKYVEVRNTLKLPDFISGIAPFYDKVRKCVALLCYPDLSEEQVADDEEDEENKPILLVISPTSNAEYEEINEECLDMAGFKTCAAASYQLNTLYNENIFTVCNGRDVILATPRDLEDHLDWLYDKGYYDQCIQTAKERVKEISEEKFRSLGFGYLNHLMAIGEYEKAAANAPSILGTNDKYWQNLVLHFIKNRQLHVIMKYIPTREPQLESAFYEAVLMYFLGQDHEEFLHWIKHWPHHIYNIHFIIAEVLSNLQKIERMQREHRERALKAGEIKMQPPTNLLEALATLYQYDSNFGDAIKIHLKYKVGKNDVFHIIESQNLYSQMASQVERLLDFDQERALRVLIAKKEDMPVDVCVEQLMGRRELLFKYLDALFHHDQHCCDGYYDLLVELYAEFDPDQLMHFFREDPTIDLRKALNVCESRQGLTRETVYLLKRTGDHSKALAIIYDKLDVDDAIEYCKDVDESTLWDELINRSIENADYVSKLLNNIGTHVDPMVIIRKIRDDLQVPGLRDSLVKILQDYNLQRNLTHGCNRILVKDCFELMNRMVCTQKRGVFVSEARVCLECHGSLVVGEVKNAADITTFNCSHAFHSACIALRSGNVLSTGLPSSASSASLASTASVAPATPNQSECCPQCSDSK